jgi:hypothetical protein
MKTLASTALLLALASPWPAAAQFFPHIAASRFCSLRSVGVDYQDALAAAIRESFSSNRPVFHVTHNGRRTTSDVVEMVQAVASMCPAALQK